jgi:hypothetical protein
MICGFVEVNQVILVFGFGGFFLIKLDYFYSLFFFLILLKK